MRSRAIAGLASFLVAAACGGNVVVDGLGVSGSATSTSGGAANSASTASQSVGETTTTSSGSILTGPSQTTGVGGGTAGDCGTSCGQTLATGITPCDGLPFSQHGALLQCACVSASNNGCAKQCSDNACALQAATAGCVSCMAASCADQYSACLAN